MKRISDWEEAGRIVAKRIVRHTGLTFEEADAAVSSILGCVRETDEHGFLIVRDESGREVARVPESVLRGIHLPTG